MPSPSNHQEVARSAHEAYLSIHDRLPTQRAKVWSGQDREKVISIDDVYDLIQPGDGYWYAGCKPHSLAIRIGCVSSVSHGGLFDRDQHGVYIVEALEFKGIRRIELREALAENERSWPLWRGTLYWAPVDRYRFYDYDGEAAMVVAAEQIKKNAQYGRIAVGYNSLFHLPIIRDLAYWRWHRTLDEEWKDAQPYCSMGQKLWTIGGGEDPVPGRASQLCSPQDTWQSMFWVSKKAAIVRKYAA